MTSTNLWSRQDHAQAYLEKRASFSQRRLGVESLLEWVPASSQRVLDLGAGDGDVLGTVLSHCPEASGVAVDFSPSMLDAARARFEGDPRADVVAHDLAAPLPVLGSFDVVVSGFAIHHLDHERKRSLYGEVLGLLRPGGIFCNLEHVASPTDALHVAFLISVGMDPDDDDPSNQLLHVETQLRWLRELGFVEVDCHWKWRELALLVGAKPGR